MNTGLSISFIVIVCVVLIADFKVFIWCQTYKTPTSLLISVCLSFDLICRLG